MERNWFFRLSRYRDAIEERDRVGPARRSSRRHDATRCSRSSAAACDDFSVSRAVDRAGGWGIPVPGDPSQTVYVWFDALANYITELGYGGDDGEFERVVARRGRAHPRDRQGDHALPRRVLAGDAAVARASRCRRAIVVHDYLTVDGGKIGKSRGNGADPTALADAYATDALRWWFVRSVPRVGDFDFRESALAGAATELANGLGNLVGRIVALAAARPGRPVRSADETGCGELLAAAGGLPATVDVAIDGYDLRGAADAVWRVVEHANRTVSELRPWELARAVAAGDTDAGRRLDAILADLLEVAGILGEEVEPFLPAAATRIAGTLRTLEPESARALFRKPGQPPP